MNKVEQEQVNNVARDGIAAEVLRSTMIDPSRMPLRVAAEAAGVSTEDLLAVIESRMRRTTHIGEEKELDLVH